MEDSKPRDRDVTAIGLVLAFAALLCVPLSTQAQPPVTDQEDQVVTPIQLFFPGEYARTVAHTARMLLLRRHLMNA